MQFPVNSDVTEFDYSVNCLKKLRGIAFGHLNICHLVNKVDLLEILLKDSDLDFLSLSETFLDDSVLDGELNIPGYGMFRSDRAGDGCKRSGGGLLMYYSTAYEVSEVHRYCSPNLELLCVKLCLPKAKPTLVISFYRPPSAKVDNSLSEFEEQMLNVDNLVSYDIVINGDCNIDYGTMNPSKRKLLTFLKSFNLEQMISVPTRTTTTTSTCIDHIYVNNTDLYNHRGTVNPGLSDHDLTFICRKRAKICRAKKSIRIRNYRQFDISSFQLDVKLTDWTPVTCSTDIDVAISKFNSIFTAILDKHLPWKRIRVRIYNSPWITNEFHSLIDARRYHSNQYKRCPCPRHFTMRKEAQRSVQRLKNSLKRSYVQDCLNKFRHKPKKLWKEIRQFWPSTKAKN